MKKNLMLILGDILAIGLVTFIGFATHGEAGFAFLPRMAAFFFPLLISWFLLAPGLGLFQQQITASPKQLWRPMLGMAYAAPFAAVLRGLILNAPILPIFGVVLIATSAFGMLAGGQFICFWNENRRRTVSIITETGLLIGVAVIKLSQ